MKPTTKERKAAESYTFTNDQLITKIKNLMGQWKYHSNSNTPVSPKTLAEFLYKIDFITARKEENGKIYRKYYDQSRRLQSQFADFGFQWEVHPAYRWALQLGNVQDVFNSLDAMSSDNE